MLEKESHRGEQKEELLDDGLDGAQRQAALEARRKERAQRRQRIRSLMDPGSFPRTPTGRGESDSDDQDMAATDLEVQLVCSWRSQQLKARLEKQRQQQEKQHQQQHQLQLQLQHKQKCPGDQQQQQHQHRHQTDQQHQHQQHQLKKHQHQQYQQKNPGHQQQQPQRGTRQKSSVTRNLSGPLLSEGNSLGRSSSAGKGRSPRKGPNDLASAAPSLDRARYSSSPDEPTAHPTRSATCGPQRQGPLHRRHLSAGSSMLPVSPSNMGTHLSAGSSMLPVSPSSMGVNLGAPPSFRGSTWYLSPQSPGALKYGGSGRYPSPRTPGLLETYQAKYLSPSTPGALESGGSGGCLHSPTPDPLESGPGRRQGSRRSSLSADFDSQLPKAGLGSSFHGFAGDLLPPEALRRIDVSQVLSQPSSPGALNRFHLFGHP